MHCSVIGTKSPDVNRRFFDVLIKHGNLQFAVDVGVKATNVTRLERLVRNADAFVGIYPFPSDDESRAESGYGTTITVPQTTRVFRYRINKHNCRAAGS